MKVSYGSHSDDESHAFVERSTASTRAPSTSTRRVAVGVSFALLGAAAATAAFVALVEPTMERPHVSPPTMELAEASSLFASLAAELSLDDNAAFDELDVDGDGLVTNDEYVGRLSTRRDDVLTKLTQSNLAENVQQPIATMINDNFDTEAACVANSGERALDKDTFEFVHPLLESLCKTSMAANTVPSGGVEDVPSAGNDQAPPQGDIDVDVNAQTDVDEDLDVDVEPSPSEGDASLPSTRGAGAADDGSNRDEPTGSQVSSPEDESPVSDEFFEPTTSRADTTSNSNPSNGIDEENTGGLASSSEDTISGEDATAAEIAPTGDGVDEPTRDVDSVPTVTEGEESQTTETADDDAAIPSDSIPVVDGTDVNNIDNESTGSDDANDDNTTPPTSGDDTGNLRVPAEDSSLADATPLPDTSDVDNKGDSDYTGSLSSTTDDAFTNAKATEDTNDDRASDEPLSSSDESNGTGQTTASSTDEFNFNDANVEPAVEEGEDGGGDFEPTTSPSASADDTSEFPFNVVASGSSANNARETPLPVGQPVADTSDPISMPPFASPPGDVTPNAADALALEPTPEPKSLARLHFEHKLFELFQNELARREQRLADAELQVEKYAFVMNLLQECIVYAGRQFEFDAFFSREQAVEWIKSDCLPLPGHFRPTEP